MLMFIPQWGTVCAAGEEKGAGTRASTSRQRLGREISWVTLLRRCRRLSLQIKGGSWLGKCLPTNEQDERRVSRKRESNIFYGRDGYSSHTYCFWRRLKGFTPRLQDRTATQEVVLHVFKEINSETKLLPPQNCVSNIDVYKKCVKKKHTNDLNQTFFLGISSLPAFLST